MAGRRKRGGSVLPDREKTPHPSEALFPEYFIATGTGLLRFSRFSQLSSSQPKCAQRIAKRSAMMGAVGNNSLDGGPMGKTAPYCKTPIKNALWLIGDLRATLERLPPTRPTNPPFFGKMPPISRPPNIRFWFYIRARAKHRAKQIVVGVSEDPAPSG